MDNRCNLRFFFLFDMAMVALNRSKESIQIGKILHGKFGSTGYVRGDMIRFLSVAEGILFLITR